MSVAIPCANTAYLNAYLCEQDRAERRDNWIELEAAVHFTEMQPLNYSALDEAVSEVMADGKRNTEILKAFAGGDDAELGAAIRAAVKAYWLDYCRMKAEDAYDDGAAEADYGRY